MHTVIEIQKYVRLRINEQKPQKNVAGHVSRWPRGGHVVSLGFFRGILILAFYFVHAVSKKSFWPTFCQSACVSKLSCHVLFTGSDMKSVTFSNSTCAQKFCSAGFFHLAYQFCAPDHGSTRVLVKWSPIKSVLLVLTFSHTEAYSAEQ
jgi:hypothetical protein